ncbi:protein HGH1 homolog isoform X2 [Phaenicophaeus curvirostris]|uniref:protein HGH1 homolog isoform X2 n=1 Tax=Phaenicophaeus curvirostris TaxID=33595 RepID=UPI0037F0DB31
MEEAAVAELAALLAAPAARAGAAEAALALSGSAEGRRLLLEGRHGVLEALLELATKPWPPAACCASGGKGGGCQVNPGGGCQVNPGGGCQVNPGGGCQVNPGGGCQVNPGGGCQVNPALSCLVNLSSEPAAREPLLAALPALLGLLPAGPACGALANVCREPGAAQRVLRGLEESGPGLASLLEALGEPRPPPELGSLLCNLSQVPEGRRGILDRSRRSVQRLLPHTQLGAPIDLRRGAVGALRNCCFQHEDHEWLLGEEVDVLPFLLLPLAGPEEFPEDEMERLPVDLQYLPADKKREEDPEIRKMLLESIMLVLIGDDPPPGLENLLLVEVPEELELRLQRLDLEEDEERWQRERPEGTPGGGGLGEDLGDQPRDPPAPSHQP